MESLARWMLDAIVTAALRDAGAPSSKSKPRTNGAAKSKGPRTRGPAGGTGTPKRA